MSTKRKELDSVILEAIKNSKTKLSDREFLFVFPTVAQVVAADRTIDVLIQVKESACLGLICRQIFEMLVSLEYVFSFYHLHSNLFCDFL